MFEVVLSRISNFLLRIYVHGGPLSLKLHGLITNNMIFQAGKPARIAGKAKPGQKIMVKMAGKSAEVKADKKGNFEAVLPPFTYGGPYSLSVGGKIIKNVLIGDIWVCSGQSNMEFTMNEVNNAKEEIEKAKYCNIRILTVQKSLSGGPEEDLPPGSSWKEVSPESIRGFSAAAYFFAREIHEKTGFPVGLINASWGGTRIEPWISMEGFRKWECYSEEINKYAVKFKKAVKRTEFNWPREKPAAPVVELKLHADSGNAGLALGFANPDFEDSKLKSMELPGYWTDKGLDFVGALWLRKTVNIPNGWIGSDLYLSLGAFTDFDTAYVNGEKVGFTGIETPDFWAVNRKYVVPSKLVRPGKNIIAVRVFAHKTHGGSCGSARDMFLSVINMPKKGELKLFGKWKYIVEKKLPRLYDVSPESNLQGLDSVTPTWVYNSMIAPVEKFPIKGVLWYQGEANGAEPEKYETLLPLLIKDWRNRWGGEEFPFYIVQLASYNAGVPWAKLRDAQFKALSVKNTGLAVAIDIGEPDNIHPKNKQDVGKRLALNALAKVYGKNIEYSGPLPVKAEKKGKQVIVSFSHAAGLKTKGFGGKLKGFETESKNGLVDYAPAKISGNKVVLSLKNRGASYVRYAWENYPECNLYNGANLPAVPFRKKIES